MYFVSSNINKFNEITDLIQSFGPIDLNLRFKQIELEEIQSDSLRKVSEFKSLQGFKKTRELTLVEDDGLFIESLNGFPGVYSSYVFKTVGNNGILKLLSEEKQRKAVFRSIFVLNNGRNIEVFAGEICGSISHSSCGKGWGYDPIFIPLGYEKTFAQLGYELKNKISHRKIAFEKLCKWYLANKLQ